MSRDLSGKASGFHPADRIKGFLGPTVWHEFTPMAAQYNAVNLGQGFPGWQAPEFVRDAIKQAVDEGFNQYCRSAGHPSLVQVVADKYGKAMGRKIDPMTEVVIGNGATESLFAITQGLLNPGDEVLLIEPSFDIYSAQAEMAGATTRSVPLRLNEETKSWYIDMSELRAGINEKTRILWLNTPQNPTGKVFSKQELQDIADIVRDFPDLVVISDEVYDELVFDTHEHTHISSLPGMWERTITVGSAGKMFSVTGWKVGWCIGPEHLMRPVAIVHQWDCFSTSTPAQEAVARALTRATEPYEGHENYYAWLLSEYDRKRGLLATALRDAGITPIIPEGSFFIIGDTSKIQLPEEYAKDDSVTHDWAMCRFLCKEIGVASIPPSAFYCEENKALAANYAR